MKPVRTDPVGYGPVRRRILDRDGWRCQYCGARERLDVHHIVPRARGGTDEDWNLITLCRRCHQDLHFVHGLGGTA